MVECPQARGEQVGVRGYARQRAELFDMEFVRVEVNPSLTMADQGAGAPWRSCGAVP